MPLARKFVDGFPGLAEVFQVHAAKDVLRLDELDAFIVGDFNPIAPGAIEIQKSLGDDLHAHALQNLTNRVLVIDHQAEMTSVVTRLTTAGR